MVVEVMSSSYLSKLLDDDDENKIVFQFAVAEMVLKLMSEPLRVKIKADDDATRVVCRMNVFIIVSELNSVVFHRKILRW